jgi:hypothetical protein
VSSVRKTLILVLIFMFASTALALASWKVVDLVKGTEDSAPGQEAASMVEEEAAEGSEGAPADAAAGEDEAASQADAETGIASGEDFSYDSPDERLVSETQRHQNFFVALGEGRVKRLDAIATDYQPVGDPNTSYMYFTVTTTDGTKSDGTMVLKYEGGLWRIANVHQLQGELGGGTDYVVPDSFEADLAGAIQEQQEFLTKVAEGRLDYMIVDSVVHASDTETVLNGRVVGIGGRIEPARMVLHKDYNLWHITDIECL